MTITLLLLIVTLLSSWVEAQEREYRHQVMAEWARSMEDAEE